MKDCGVEWIGMIPDGWTLGRIGELYSERNQKVSDVDYPPLSVTMQGVLPQLANVAKTDAHDDRKLVRCGDFAINSRSDRRGSCGIADRDGSVSLINTVLCPRNEMNPRYYNWLFHTTMFADEFYKWGHGIVDDLWTTRWADMKQMSVPCPSLSEQKRIAEYLDAKCAVIDDVIAKTTESIEEYKKLKQAVITEAVTNGVRGKRPMKDSDIDWIGQIPEGWNVVKITRILDDRHPYAIGDGDHGLISPSDYVSEGVPYIRVQNLGWGTEISSKGLVYISEETNKRIEGSTLHPGDVLFAKTGATIGKTGIIPEYFGIANTTSHVGKITVAKNICPKFIMYILASTIGYKQFWDIASQKSTRPELAINEIKAMKVLVPPNLEEQREIADYLDSKCAAIDTLKSKKQQFIDELTAYKKSLIYEFVTGKKEVPA